MRQISGFGASSPQSFPHAHEANSGALGGGQQHRDDFLSDVITGVSNNSEYFEMDVVIAERISFLKQ